MVKRKTSSEKGFRRRLIIKNPKNRPRDTAVGLFLGGLLVSRGRKGRLNAWCSIFCFKYGKKHDGREGIDGFRRPLHCRDRFPMCLFYGEDCSKFNGQMAPTAYK